MLTVLKRDEINSVSGGWVCEDTYEGRAFYKAAWYMFTPNDSKSYGRCYYGVSRQSRNVRFPAKLKCPLFSQQKTKIWQ